IRTTAQRSLEVVDLRLVIITGRHQSFPTYLLSFFTDPATTEIYTLSLHDALPILNRANPNFEVTRHLVKRCDVWLESGGREPHVDRKSTRLNSSHVASSYAVFCLKKKNRRWLAQPA